MKQNTTLEAFQQYFDMREVVSKQVYERYGTACWSFFDPRLLAVVAWLRKEMGIPLVCNNWANGGKFDERGFRANCDPIVKKKTIAGMLYCSAHSRGQGIDLSSGRATANEIRQWIRMHREDLPCPIRLESDKSAPTWVHIDVCNTGTDPIVEFSV